MRPSRVAKVLVVWHAAAEKSKAHADDMGGPAKKAWLAALILAGWAASRGISRRSVSPEVA